MISMTRESYIGLMLERLCLGLIILVTIMFVALGLIDVPNEFYIADDSHVYMGTAVRVLGGKTPYTDLHLAHPPGLLLVNVALGRLGMGMVGQSYVFYQRPD